MSITFLCILWAIFAGLIVLAGCWVISAYTETDCRMSKSAIAAGLAAGCLCIAPLVAYVGSDIVRESAVRYNEYWNGYEVAAQYAVTKCQRDGQCRHTYDCDPYEVTETHTSTDSKGNVTTHTTTETKYHSCPEATEEFRYWVETTLGDFTVVSSGFSDNPISWRSGNSLPASVHRGVPKFWADAKTRIDQGDPGPVTEVNQYDNFILASQSSLLKKYSAAVEDYKAQGLLPKHSGELHDLYHVNKVSFVGINVPDQQAWQDSLEHLNAAAGTQLQGDVHLVVVPADRVTNPDEYAGALAAYWQSKEFGRNALSKNGIGVVVAVKDAAVSWSRSFTGMPLGNEGLMQDISSRLKGVAFSPEQVIGHPVASFGDGEGFDHGVRITHGTGAIESALWGPEKFLRVSMGGDESSPGYKYLKAELQPSGSQRTTMAVITFVLSLLAWAGIAFVNFSTKGKRKGNSRASW